VPRKPAPLANLIKLTSRKCVAKYYFILTSTFYTTLHVDIHDLSLKCYNIYTRNKEEIYLICSEVWRL
jgi:hypothetical protein